MSPEKVFKEFRAAGALLEGHFVLSSGLHSRQYLQCARVLMDPKRAARLCKALAKKLEQAGKGDIDYVVSPAMGGVIVGFEMGRQLNVPAMFLERVKGVFELRRGFDLPKVNGRKPRVLMVEDIVTTGLSSREAIAAIRACGGNVVAGACLIDRSNGKAKIGVKLFSLAQLNIETFDKKNLPEDLKKLPVIKPGSRALKK
ncbi:MAG: orotate phosphoribosyltransferase [Parvibaculales bacterium]